MIKQLILIDFLIHLAMCLHLKLSADARRGQRIVKSDGKFSCEVKECWRLGKGSALCWNESEVGGMRYEPRGKDSLGESDVRGFNNVEGQVNVMWGRWCEGKVVRGDSKLIKQRGLREKLGRERWLGIRWSPGKELWCEEEVNKL